MLRGADYTYFVVREGQVLQTTSPTFYGCGQMIVFLEMMRSLVFVSSLQFSRLKVQLFQCILSPPCVQLHQYQPPILRLVMASNAPWLHFAPLFELITSIYGLNDVHGLL